MLPLSWSDVILVGHIGVADESVMTAENGLPQCSEAAYNILDWLSKFSMV